jgi:hypothetical protein
VTRIGPPVPPWESSTARPLLIVAGMRSALILFLLSAAPVQAAALVVVSPAGLYLKDNSVGPCPDADICFSDGHVEARYGIRLESRPGEFAASSPLVLDEPFLAKGATGEQFRFWIRAVVENRVFVEAELRGEAPAPRPAAGVAFAGRFKVEHAQIGGEETDPRYPTLTLEQDGSFKLGSTHGLWNLTDGKVILSGHFAAWGAAEVQSDTLTFRFQRGELSYELIFSRVTEPAARYFGAVTTAPIDALSVQ